MKQGLGCYQHTMVKLFTVSVNWKMKITKLIHITGNLPEADKQIHKNMLNMFKCFFFSACYPAAVSKRLITAIHSGSKKIQGFH